MARLVTTNNAVNDIMSAGTPTAEIADFVARQTAVYSNMFSGVANAVSNRIVEYGKAYVATDAARMAGAIIGQVSTAFQGSGWRRISSRAAIQNVPDVMLRAAMAMPEIRELANKGLCNAYDGRYVDLYPTENPKDHRDYKLVTNGEIEFFDDNDDAEWDYQFSTYSDNYEEDDEYENLNSIQRMQIAEMWEVGRALISEDTDPSDRWNGSLR